MKLHEAKLLLNDPTFSIDSITYQELEMDSDYVDVHEDISYSKDKFHCMHSSRCQPLSALSRTAFRTLPQNCDVDQQ